MAYVPGVAPSDPKMLSGYLQIELRNMMSSIGQGIPELYIIPRSSEPARPRNGMLANADGTNWDPGEGAGIYVYENGSWVRLARQADQLTASSVFLME